MYYTNGYLQSSKAYSQALLEYKEKILYTSFSNFFVLMNYLLKFKLQILITAKSSKIPLLTIADFVLASVCIHE